jgi:heat shock protein HslJ
MTACQADETISGYSDAGIVWVLSDLQGNPPKSQITLTFPEKSKIAGKAPCNRYFGAQKKPLPWFETGPIASTKMACPHLDEEAKYFDALENASLAEVSKTTLILSNNDGVLLIYKRQ